jgi:hypothetical protein
MTPPTIEGTAFEKNGRANPWSIVDGEFFDVEDYAGIQILPSFLNTVNIPVLAGIRQR